MRICVVALALLIVVPLAVVLIRKSFHSLRRIVIFFTRVVVYSRFALSKAVLIYSVGMRLSAVRPAVGPFVLLVENDIHPLRSVSVQSYGLSLRSMLFLVIVILPHLRYGVRYGRLDPRFRARALRLYYRGLAYGLSVLRLARHVVVSSLAKHHVVFPVDVLHVAVPLVIPARYLRSRSIPDVVPKTFLEL